jgi:hypothetical protein
MNESQAVYFEIVLGAVSAGGTGLIKIQMSEDNGVSDPFIDVAQTGLTYTSVNSQQLGVIDIYRPQRQYLRVAIIRGTGGNTAITAILALAYHLQVAPVLLDTTVMNVIWLSNPGPGAP